MKNSLFWLASLLILLSGVLLLANCGDPNAETCLDKDNDKFMDTKCGGTDCDDSDPAIHPGAPEICDGKDNNCDGQTDNSTAEEICTDGIDNDCDGLTDCQDPQCEGFYCDDKNPATTNESCIGGVCKVAIQPQCTYPSQRPCGTKCGHNSCQANGQWGSACEGEGECEANATLPCGRCGTKSCSSVNCTWGTCTGEHGSCAKDEVVNCPNNCGTKTCGANCEYGKCSRSGELVVTTQKCWSPNHCCPNKGVCVDCWQRCDDSGVLHTDNWCSTCINCAGHTDACKVSCSDCPCQ